MKSLPPFAAAVLFVALAVAVWAVAAQHERPPPKSQAAHRGDGGPAFSRDILTGRPVDAAGVPVRPETGPGSSKAPLRLRFVPAADRADAEASIGELLRFLGERTGYAIEGAVLLSYALVVEELIEGTCDVAFLTAASYARAHYATAYNDDPDDDLVAFLAAVRHGTPEFPSSDLAYRAAFLVRNDSALRRVEDIGNETRVAMGMPTSGASSILPMALLERLGKRPRVVRFGGGYPLLVGAVLDGSVDVACIWWSPPNEDNPANDARITARAHQPDVFEQTRLIGFTEWIPNEPVVARKALPASIRHELARALALFVATRVVTTEGRRSLEAVGSLIGYIPATDDDFKAVLDVIERAFASDPAGLADFQRDG